MVNKPLIRPYFWGGTLGGGLVKKTTPTKSPKPGPGDFMWDLIKTKPTWNLKHQVLKQLFQLDDSKFLLGKWLVQPTIPSV